MTQGRSVWLQNQHSFSLCSSLPQDSWLDHELEGATSPFPPRHSESLKDWFSGLSSHTSPSSNSLPPRSL